MNFLKKNSRALTQPQKSIFSAATIIMIMIATSRFLGLIRNRILAHYFSAETLSIYFAAFRLPEVVFEILVFGTFTSAFIPVFTSYFSKRKKSEAWKVAAMSLNFSLIAFGIFTILVFWLAKPIYRLITPGLSGAELEKLVTLVRILLFTQGFFLLSYFLTAILESLRRFLIPAIAPIFYNLGIILGTVFFNNSLGIAAPAVGAVLGAFVHFAIQLFPALKLGFRWQKKLDFRHPGLRKIGKLAFPRIIQLSFLQVSKGLELFLASLVGSAAYTHLTFANSLQLLPISLFGASIAKASFPTLSYQAKKPRQFAKTLLSSFNQILFLTIPLAVFLIVLRVPMVRIFFGAPRFNWESTLQTSYALTAFSLSIPMQALIFLLNRSFYALQDTLTPMAVSLAGIFLNVIFALLATFIFHLPIWGLALAFSLSSILQFAALFILVIKKNHHLPLKKFFNSFSKILSASLISGGLMYVLLKILDRSAWDKRLSFLGKLGMALPTSFDLFVLDTRYIFDLLLITCLTASVGGVIFLLLCWWFKAEELFILIKMVGKIENLSWFSKKFWKKREAITIDQSSPRE